jgi:hypothetical protein
MGLAIGECAAMDTAVVILLAQLFLDGRSRLSIFLTAAFNSSGDTPNLFAVPAMLLTEAIRCSDDVVF